MLKHLLIYLSLIWVPKISMPACLPKKMIRIHYIFLCTARYFKFSLNDFFWWGGMIFFCVPNTICSSHSFFNWFAIFFVWFCEQICCFKWDTVYFLITFCAMFLIGLCYQLFFFINSYPLTLNNTHLNTDLFKAHISIINAITYIYIKMVKVSMLFNFLM